MIEGRRHRGHDADRNQWGRATLCFGVGVILVALLAPTGGLLAALPVLSLLVALGFGRYPGEGALERIRLAGRHRARRTAATPAPRPHLASFVRGGVLIARRLAERGPPVAPVPSH